MRMMSVTPEATASSTPYWMIGLSTSGSISFGWALVAGRNRVPRPAAGNTALRTGVTTAIVAGGGANIQWTGTIMYPNYVRNHIEDVRDGLRNRGLDPDRALEELATLETARRRLIPELEG